MTVVFLETLHLVDVTQIFKEESTEKKKKNGPVCELLQTCL